MNNKFIKAMLILSFLIPGIDLFSQNVAINTSGNAAYTGALLDLSNHNTTGATGFLPPYVSLSSSTSLTGTITGGTASQLSGLLVYNTNTSLTGGLSGPGLYYWNNALATPAWVYLGASGGTGVTSITGTSPVIVTPTTGAAVVSLQGSAGTVCYGTGGGSNFTAAGTAPTPAAGTGPAGGAQVLVSQGTGTPTWNTAGGGCMVWYRGLANNGTNNAAAAGEYAIVGYTNNTAGIFYSTAYFGGYTAANSETEMKMPKCVITRIHVYVANSTAGATQTFKIVDATSATITTMGTIANNPGAGVYDLTSGTAVINDGDLVSIENVGSASAGALYISKIDVDYYILP